MTDTIIIVNDDSSDFVIVSENGPALVIETGVPSSSGGSLSSLSDVSATNPQEGQFLSFQSGLWRPTDIVDSSIQSSLDGGEFM